MTIRVEFLRFLRQLLEATTARSIEWKETAEEETFRTTFRDGIVHISNEQDSTPCVAQVFNRNNRLVEEIRGTNEEEEALLRTLFEAARTAALKPTDVLKAIEAELVSRLKR